MPNGLWVHVLSAAVVKEPLGIAPAFSGFSFDLALGPGAWFCGPSLFNFLLFGLHGACFCSPSIFELSRSHDDYHLCVAAQVSYERM